MWVVAWSDAGDESSGDDHYTLVETEQEAGARMAALQEDVGVAHVLIAPVADAADPHWIEKLARAEPLGITLGFSAKDAHRLQQSLADLACWHRGYAAGRPIDDEHDPMGVEAIRTLNRALKAALDAAEREGCS